MQAARSFTAQGVKLPAAVEVDQHWYWYWYWSASTASRGLALCAMKDLAACMCCPEPLHQVSAA